MSEQACPHCGDQIHWSPSANEAGWKCCACGHRPGEPSGYDPARDRACILDKVDSILHIMHAVNLIHVSNGTHGESIASSAAAKCLELDRYDQTTIVRAIAELDSGHVDYWHKIGSGVVSGQDSRERCPGGRLAQMFSYKNGKPIKSCFDKACEPCQESRR